MRLRRPLPAVQGDTLHIVGVGDNRIGKRLALSALVASRVSAAFFPMKRSVLPTWKKLDFLGRRLRLSAFYHMPAGGRAGRCGNERRDWRIHAALAAAHPRDAVRRRRTGVGPDQYRLRPGLDDHRSVPVGLSVGALPHHQGGGEDAHAARPAGQHSEFYRMASCTTFMPSICSCRKPEPSTSWIVATSTLPAFMCCIQAGAFFVTRAKSNIDAHRVYSRAPTDRSTGIHLRPDHLAWTAATTRQDYAELLRRIRFKDPESGKTLVFITNNFSLPAATICSALQKPLAGGTLLQVDQGIFGSSSSTARRRTRSLKTQIWIAVSVDDPRRHRQEAPRPGRLALHFVTDPLGDPPRKCPFAGDENRCNASQITNQLNLFDF